MKVKKLSEYRQSFSISDSRLISIGVAAPEPDDPGEGMSVLWSFMYADRNFLHLPLDGTK
jgi:hypothetical protein